MLLGYAQTRQIIQVQTVPSQGFNHQKKYKIYKLGLNWAKQTFWIQFWGAESFRPKFCYTQTFLKPKFLTNSFFLVLFGPKFIIFLYLNCWTKEIFWQQIFLDHKFFWTKILLNQKFLTQNFVFTQKFFKSNFFWPIRFWPKFF